MLESAHHDFIQSLKQAIIDYQLGELAADNFNSLLVGKTQFLLNELASVLGHYDACPSNDNPNARSFRFVQSTSAEDLLPFHQILNRLWDACARCDSINDFLELTLPTRALLQSHGVSVKTSLTGEYFLELAE